MVKLVAGILALIALAASLLSGVDPVECLARGAIAYLVGWIGASVWCALFDVNSASSAPTNPEFQDQEPENEASAEDAEAA